MNDEKWCKVNNFEDYAVSNYGRFYSFIKDEFIKGYFHKSRTGIYIRVCFNRKQLMAHTVVCSTFNIFPEHLKNEKNVIVNHLNGNTCDNRAENLAFDTQSNNVKHFHYLRRKPELVY